ncbi:MAG: hypothetical protein JNM43_28975 [Planctomycetaceae bacterium]|nr:hypothetical protein [Planctomycetaceae bacterium]
MARKPRHRPVHYTMVAFPGGAVATCTPRRKPSPKQIKANGLQIDVDYVCNEYLLAPDEFDEMSQRARGKISDILANRMNTRRAIRDLVLPVLSEIQSSIQQINNRLNEIERSLKSSAD